MSKTLNIEVLNFTPLKIIEVFPVMIDTKAINESDTQHKSFNQAIYPVIYPILIRSKLKLEFKDTTPPSYLAGLLPSFKVIKDDSNKTEILAQTKPVVGIEILNKHMISSESLDIAGRRTSINENIEKNEEKIKYFKCGGSKFA